MAPGASRMLDLLSFEWEMIEEVEAADLLIDWEVRQPRWSSRPLNNGQPILSPAFRIVSHLCLSYPVSIYDTNSHSVLKHARGNASSHNARRTHQTKVQVRQLSLCNGGDSVSPTYP